MGSAILKQGVFMSSDETIAGNGADIACAPAARELGIALVPPSRQTKRPRELFFIWCAANIGILGVVYGAIIVSFGLSFLQSLLAAVLGSASFALVGMTSHAGIIGRTTTLTLSRASFGRKGNIAPTAFVWIYQMGWEVVEIVTGTLTLAAFFDALGFQETFLTTAISLLLFGGLTVIVSVLGQDIVVAMQKIITWIFGAMTLFVLCYLLSNADWITILSLPHGNWISGFLPAVSVITAGTGIGWVYSGADYSRDQSPSSPSGCIFASVVGGAMLPLVLVMLTGILLTAQIPNLASHENPISAIGLLLPAWMALPYLATAVAGIVSITVLDLYSASLNLLALGIRLKQHTAVSLNAVIFLMLSAYVLFVFSDFLQPFIAFLVLCGVCLSAWAAVFLTDFFTKHRYTGYSQLELFGKTGIRTQALACWIVGSLSGLIVTDSGFIHGPLAVGVFADSSLGVFVSFLVALGSYLMLSRKNRRRGK